MGTLLDLTGKVFGRLTVKSRDGSGTPVRWLCECACGKRKSVGSQKLRLGETQSCGCLHKEVAAQLMSTLSAQRKQKPHWETKRKAAALAAAKEIWRSREARANRRLDTQILWMTDGYREKVQAGWAKSDRKKKRWSNCAATAKMWSDPVYRRRTLNAMKKAQKLRTANAGIKCPKLASSRRCHRPRPEFTPMQIWSILGRFFLQGHWTKHIAAEFDCSPSLISEICNGHKYTKTVKEWLSSNPNISRHAQGPPNCLAQKS